MSNLDELFKTDMAFRDIVIETAAHAIGSTSKEFAEEWLMAGDVDACPIAGNQFRDSAKMTNLEWLMCESAFSGECKMALYGSLSHLPGKTWNSYAEFCEWLMAGVDAQRDNDETCPIGDETCPNDGIEHSMDLDSGQRELESDSRENLGSSLGSGSEVGSEVDGEQASKQQIGQSDAPKSEETAENATSKGDIRDFDDSREKLEADVLKESSSFVHTPYGFRKIRGWLDRQAAITRKTEQSSWIQQANGLIYEANSERDRLKEELAKRDKGIERLKKQRDEAREELRKISSEVMLVAAERDALARDLAESDKLREELREKLSTALGHAHDILALVNLDGEVI